VTNEKSAVRELEEGAQLRLDFTKLAKVGARCPTVIPVAVQDADTKEVILLAYTNEAALRLSLETRIATFWSTSRNELWVKGKTSGNYFELIEARVNCEQNSLVYLVRPKGDAICHTHNASGKSRNCFYRRIDFGTGALQNLDP